MPAQPRQPKLQYQIMQSGITQRELAKRCGFPIPRVSDYIHGVRPIPPRHMISICAVLKCSPEDILGTTTYINDMSRG